MKPILIACLSMLVLITHAQTDTTDKPGNCLKANFCTYRLEGTNAPFTCHLPAVRKSYAKDPVSPDYTGDVDYADENNDRCTVDLPDDETDRYCNPNTDALFYDVYYPQLTLSSYKSCPLPALLYIHGGGFSNCVADEGNSAICQYFAEKGFVVFNISYRVGVQIKKPYVTVQQQLATYRARQDVRGALRSILKTQYLQSGLSDAQKTRYQINSDYIFLAGNSAGAITALNVAYYPTQQMVDNVNPYTGTTKISDALGMIDADYYYGDINNPNYAIGDRIKGVLSEWGSVTVPPQTTSSSGPNSIVNFFNGVKIPVIAFYGANDITVNPGIANVNFAASSTSNPQPSLQPYNIETSCLSLNVTSFQTNNNLSSIDAKTYGSEAFFTYYLQNPTLNIPSEIYKDCQMGHGLDNNSNFRSDFGTCLNTQDKVLHYIAGRAAVFFQSIITGSAQSRQNSAAVHKIFIESANNHTLCDLNNLDQNYDETKVCQANTGFNYCVP